MKFSSLLSRGVRPLNYFLLFLFASVLASCVSSGLNTSPNIALVAPKAGGNTTLYNRSSHAFAQPAPGLTLKEDELHAVGDATFEAIFVTAPANVNPGLGPVFNNNSCAACHIKNGRGMPELGQSLVRVSLPDSSEHPLVQAEGVVPVPNIGVQLRDHAVYGTQPDAKVELSWQEISGNYIDGTSYVLRTPELEISQVDAAKPIPKNILTSLRIPPPVFGVGLLEVIPEKTLRSIADPDDQDNDGISGHLNIAWDPEATAPAVGRFGLKANSPNLRHQTAAAYVNDMGVTNPIFPEKSGQQDIGDKDLEASTFYVQSLGVPARTQLDDPIVQRGEKLFTNANCAACHIDTIQTGPSDVVALANQTIHPYTDLLLHDMGEGLADNRSDFEADGQEWRTTPLWGLGLAQTVLPYSGYLHDGRARTLEEAVLWHGGEAEDSKEVFMALDKTDRQALLKFLNSL